MLFIKLQSNRIEIYLRECATVGEEKLNLKLMSYALERDTSIFFSRSVDDFHSHRFVSPPACFYIPTNLSKVWTKRQS